MEIFLMPPEMMRRSKNMREVRKYKKSSAPRLRWTPQLHDLFIQSVENLGGRNKATPKRILQMMAIKGLKISHVKSHLQMYRNMKEHPSLHVLMPDFTFSSPLHVSKRLREGVPKNSKQKESGSQFSCQEINSSHQNGENINYYDCQEAEGSISSGMTKEEEEGETYELPKADDECVKGRKFWPNHQNYSQFNNSSNTHINLDLSLS